MSTDKVLNDITSQMPEPTAVADIIQEKAQKESEENGQNNLSELGGGEQKLRKDGTPAKKRGRKPKSESSNQNASRLGGVSSAGERAIAADDAERLAAATLIVKCMEMSGLAIAGDDAKMHPMEGENLIICWEKYLRKMGINDIPPGIAVTLFTVQYYSRVLVTEKAQPFMQKVIFKFRNMFSRFKNARSNSRDDSQRKNDTGEKAGDEVQGKRGPFARS